MGVDVYDVETSELDTIDLAEELEPGDDTEAEGSLAVAVDARRTGLFELALMSIANSVWAVVGLVLWLPQSVRAVLGAVVRVVHSALTHQRSDRAVAGIQRVSRLYVDRFLRRRREPVFVGRRHELRPVRLVGEIVWVAGFYLLLLRWLAPAAFRPVWARLVAWGDVAGESARSAFEWLEGGFTSALTAVAAAGMQLVVAVLGAALVCGALGFWLGRRRRAGTRRGRRRVEE